MELYHHGIEGQKWGKRNGPPYPLGSNQMSRAEKRYNKARDLQSQADELSESGHKLKAKSIQRKATRAMKRVNAADTRWASRQKFDIKRGKYKNQDAAEQLKQLQKELKSSPLNKNGTIPSSAINQYNRALAELMNKSIDAVAPSGRVIRWVAKRGDIGVHLGFADKGYDMNNVKNGVWDSGRIAYRKDKVGKS